MAKAQQLPSGSWRVRVYDSELRKQVSFTSDLPGKAGKAEAELMAREYQLGRKKKKEQGKTVGECIDEYIALKENILSPTTIEGYRKDRRNSLAELCDIYINDLTSTDIQAHINRLALNKSPKTVRNAHGLLVSVLNTFAPELHIRTTLPKQQKKIKQLPLVEDVLRVVVGSDIELPCLLAIWCSLRMSEIRGAKKTDIKDGILTVHDTVVTVRGEHIEKHQTKTIESTRQIRLPERIESLITALPEEQLYLTPLSGQAIYKRFKRLLEKNNIESMTFHDLRHMNASVMLALGIPDKYAMERDKAEQEVNEYYAELEKIADLKAKEELMKKRFEQEQAEWKKDGITLESRYLGYTPQGKRFTITGNNGFAQRSLHCFQLIIEGQTIFTSGEFWRAYSEIKRR